MYYTENKLYKEINDAMNSTYKKTQKKETIGRHLLEDSELLDKWFKDNKGYEWIEDVDMQLSGVDYLLNTARNNKVAIDIKCCIGPDYERIPVEYDQYTESYGAWKETITDDKRTDFLLYVNVSINLHKVNFIIVNYRWLVKEMEKVKVGEKAIFDQTIPKESFNGTGHYFTISLDKCRDSRQMYVEEYDFKDLTKPGRKSRNPLEKILDTL